MGKKRYGGIEKKLHEVPGRKKKFHEVLEKSYTEDHPASLKLRRGRQVEHDKDITKLEH